MEYSRRRFIKVSSTAGSAALPLTALGRPATSKWPGALPDMDPPEGAVTVSPNQGTAAQHGTWTVTYRAGKSGVQKGGGIRMQLPDSWHAGVRNSANRLQASDAKADNYVSSHCSRNGIRLRTRVEHEPEPEVILVKNHRAGLDGRLSRYIYVVRVWVLDGELRDGDTISVVYGDTSLGSRGMQAGIVSTPVEPILTAVDLRGAGDFRMHPDRPGLKASAGPAAELLVSGPSTLVQGKPAQLLLSVVDAHQNPAESFTGEVTLRVTQGHAEVPPNVTFRSSRGWEPVAIVPKAPGIIRIMAAGVAQAPGLRATSATGVVSQLEATGNPMKVVSQEPAQKLYWGDLHSHTHYSWDGVGHNNFEYARRTSGLDFYAMTDHSDPAVGNYAQGLGPNVPRVWDEYTALTDKHYEPGKFVTLHAYECSLDKPYGHHNVYFRGKPGPLLAGDVSLPELWQALTSGHAITIPHHTGKMPFPIFWNPHDAELDRNIEIYSAHGLSEAYDPSHPLSFENSTFTGASKSVKGPQYAQDAWAQGLRLSTIASSDDHRAHPGQAHHGLAAVWATGLTREEIFDSLYRRSTYGTTGARILLDFTIDGQPMGQQVAVRGAPSMAIEAHGTAAIETVEVLRYSQSDRHFKVIYTLHPDALDFNWTAADETFREESIYYIRLRQAGLIRNQIAMAWSSPIWVKHQPPG